MLVQIVILGTGAADYEARVKAANQEWGWFCRGHVGFSVPLGHKIMAGCDILLMPSRWGWDLGCRRFGGAGAGAV